MLAQRRLIDQTGPVGRLGWLETLAPATRLAQEDPMSTSDQLAGSRRVVLRESARLARMDAVRLGQELRELRLGLGIHQADVARVVGVSRSVISELEAGDPTVGLEIRRGAAVALGADLRINTYPGATPLLHDIAHARLIERIFGRRHPCWRAQIEARVPGPGRSSTDVRLEAFGEIVTIEVEARIRAWDAVVRRCLEKRERIRDALGGRTVVHAVLCLPLTRHHRLLVASLGETVRATFPTSSVRMRRSLEEGAPWPGDGILWLAGGPSQARSGNAPTTARKVFSPGVPSTPGIPSAPRIPSAPGVLSSGSVSQVAPNEHAG
jgi:transcriptional regulator with XRE-family HTH domain